MIIFPAIDIIDGKPVRLTKGDYKTSQQVFSSVQEAAKDFEAKGARWLHLVDLDGAKAGEPVNHDLIAKTARSTSMKCEVGGGIRTMEQIDWYLQNGLERVILGTAALRDEQLLKSALEKYGECIAIGLDAKNGLVSVAGWLEDSSMDYVEFARKMEEMGAKTLICTDISKDGTLSGPNLEMLKTLQDNVSLQLTASGGIRDLNNIADLADLHLYGAICGKSLYSGSLDLKEAIERGSAC